MLYLLYGTDTEKARAKMHALVDSLTAKKPDASVVSVDADRWDESALSDFIAGQGLFERKRIVVFDHVFEDADARECVVESAADIADSPNIFVVLEGALSAAILKKLTKHTAKTQIFVAKEESEKKFDVFTLSDALGRRDRKRLWVLYQKAKYAGVRDEEIHGILFWQARAIVAAALGSASAAGLKPFVYSKSKGFARFWSLQERGVLLHTLISLFHDSRRGKHDLGDALERFLLRV